MRRIIALSLIAALINTLGCESLEWMDQFCAQEPDLCHRVDPAPEDDVNRLIFTWNPTGLWRREFNGEWEPIVDVDIPDEVTSVSITISCVDNTDGRRHMNVVGLDHGMSSDHIELNADPVSFTLEVTDWQKEHISYCYVGVHGHCGDESFCWFATEDLRNEEDGIFLYSERFGTMTTTWNDDEPIETPVAWPRGYATWFFQNPYALHLEQ